LIFKPDDAFYTVDKTILLEGSSYLPGIRNPKKIIASL
jgi:hypothetical protein